MKAVKQAVKFYATGTTTSLVNIGILFLLTDLAALWYMFSAVVAAVVSVTLNYLINRNWTFEYSGKKSQKLQYLSFWAANLIVIAIGLSILFALVEYTGLWYIFSAIIAIALGSIINFTLNKHWVFRA